MTDLPSQGRVFLQEQKQEKRYILHALYATPSLRGMQSEAFMPGMRPPRPVEVIEDLPVLYDVSFEVKVPRAVKSVSLAPEGGELPFESAGGKVRFRLPKLQCHQMVVLNY